LVGEIQQRVSSLQSFDHWRQVMTRSLFLAGLTVGCLFVVAGGPARADDWMSGLHDPGVKICSFTVGKGTTAWQSTFPVTKNWQIADCANAAAKLGADTMQLGCFHLTPPPGPPEPFVFSCPMNPKNQVCTITGLKTPDRDCGWASMDNPPAGSSAEKPGDAQSSLGDEWTKDEINHGVKVCKLSSVGWEAWIPVTDNFVLDNCREMAKNALLAAQLTLGCYWPGKGPEGPNAMYSWGLPGVPSDSTTKVGDQKYFSVPVPNCGW
jgi:hypothetical protein